MRDGYRLDDGAGPRFVDYVSDIVVFTSVDGQRYEYGYVLARADAGGVYCFEDPRVQSVEHRGSRHLVMTYTHLPPPGAGPWRSVATACGGTANGWSSTSRPGGCSGHRRRRTRTRCCSPSHGRVALIHRIHPDMQLAVFDDLDHLWDVTADYWEAYLADLAGHTLLTPSPGALGVGAGVRPVPTDAGLLLFFHERRADSSAR